MNLALLVQAARNSLQLASGLAVGDVRRCACCTCLDSCAMQRQQRCSRTESRLILGSSLVYDDRLHGAVAHKPTIKNFTSGGKV